MSNSGISFRANIGDLKGPIQSLDEQNVYHRRIFEWSEPFPTKAKAKLTYPDCTINLFYEEIPKQKLCVRGQVYPCFPEALCVPHLQ
jgi:hypothetical protein